MNTTDLCLELIEANPDYQYTKTFKRHLNDLNELDPNVYRYNQELADLYIMFLESFKHSKGELANQPIKLENWQKAAIGISMGWEYKNPKGKWVRRFKTTLFFMARKGGKTLISAGLSLADSIIRRQHGSEVVCIATKKDQAMLALNEISRMALNHPDLKKKFKRTGNKLFSKIDEGTIYALGRDSKTEDGLNISTLLCDEYHAAADSELKDVCTSSMGAREQPLTIIISTAGFTLSSPLIPELEYARKILDGQLQDERYFAFLAEPSQGDDPYTIETLRKSNPNLGVSVSEEFLLNEMKLAKERPDARLNYLTKYCNMFVNGAEDFVSAEQWRACEATEKPKPEDIKQVFIGCDLSVADDLTALSIVLLTHSNELYVESEVFIPEPRLLELAKIFRAPLRMWVNEGYLTAIKSPSIDYDFIYHRIKARLEEYSDYPTEIYYDAYKFKQIKERLLNELYFEDAFPVNQGYLTLSEPLALMGTYIREKRLHHKNNPVMNWAVSNIEITTDSYGNRKIDKSSKYKKIDPVAALLNTFVGLIPKLSEEEAAPEIFFI